MASAKRGVDFLKQASVYMTKGNDFDRYMKNLKILSRGNGKCQAELPVGPEHINLHGGLHGGVTASLVDNVATYALMSKHYRPGVSANMEIMYIKPALEGDSLIVNAHTVRAEEHLAYVECELRRKSDGDLIAKGFQVKYVDFE